MIQYLFLQNKKHPNGASCYRAAKDPKLSKYSSLHPCSFMHALNICICLKAHTDNGLSLNKGTCQGKASMDIAHAVFHHFCHQSLSELTFAWAISTNASGEPVIWYHHFCLQNYLLTYPKSTSEHLTFCSKSSACRAVAVKPPTDCNPNSWEMFCVYPSALE